VGVNGLRSDTLTRITGRGAGVDQRGRYLDPGKGAVVDKPAPLPERCPPEFPEAPLVTRRRHSSKPVGTLRVGGGDTGEVG
jgi:hypothetical protein